MRPQSRRPKTSPQFKLTDEVLGWILELRNQRFGHRRIQCELKRLHGFSLALGSIHKALHLLGLPHLKPAKRDRRTNRLRRYQKKTPDERIQVDNGKIGPKLYQYTAIDDCTRMQVVRLYSNKTAASTRAFLEQMVSALPFRVPRVQTDRGEEFFATAVQCWLMDQCIKFRPIRPYSPHLNGKMERVQRTDREEFYNRAREHGSLLYKTPA